MLKIYSQKITIVKENIDSSRIIFVEMKISKLINYWTDMC